jgi:hypothetical protein
MRIYFRNIYRRVAAWLSLYALILKLRGAVGIDRACDKTAYDHLRGR